jgi:hypothetical protein
MSAKQRLQWSGVTGRAGMLIRDLTVRTIDSYTDHVDRFAKHFGKLPGDLGPDQIRAFQLWMTSHFLDIDDLN